MKANKFITYRVCFNPFDYIIDDITELTLSKEAENIIEELKELNIVVIEIPA